MTSPMITDKTDDWDDNYTGTIVPYSIQIAVLLAKLEKAGVVLLWISLQRFSDRLTVTPENAFVAFQHLNSDSRAIMDRAATALKEINE